MPRRSIRSHEDSLEFEDEDVFERHSVAQQERLRRLIIDLLGRWYWIALGLVFGILAALYFLSKAPKKYEASSRILVKQSTGAVMNSKDQVEEIDLRTDEALNTVAQRIKRPELLKRIAADDSIRQLPGLIPPPVHWLPTWAENWVGGPDEEGADEVPLPDKLWKKISLWVEVSPKRDTRLLDVTVTHQSPEVAQALANAIALEFNRELTGDRAEGRTSSFDILVKESEAARGRLQKAQNALANYQGVLDTLKSLEEKEAVALELSRRYLPKHPKMMAAQSELETFQKRFLSEFDSVRNAQADKDYWQSTHDEWDQAQGDPNERLQTARRLLIARSSVLENEIESQTSVFNSMLTRMQESGINQQAVESEIDVDSLATLPELPVSPKPVLVLAAGMVVGVGGGLMIALILTRLDNKFHTVAQVESETSKTVLGSISQMKEGVLEGIVSKQEKKTGIPSPSYEDEWDPVLAFRRHLSETSFAEMYRVLRASITLLGDEKKRKVTAFTSSLPGEGKTTTSVNFALAAAGQGKKVLLIDADLRKPAVHKTLGLKRDHNGKGVTEILAGQTTLEEAAFPLPGVENLHVVLSGVRAPNPGELLSGIRLEKLLAQATQYFDVVVLDTAPVLAVPDTRIIAPQVDNLCLVIRANYTPKGAVRRVLEVLEEGGTPPSGAIFNGFSEKRRLIGENYSYGYYKYGKYGSTGSYGYGSYGGYGAYGSDDDDTPRKKNRKRKKRATSEA
ncbi:capsular exopolysaccharide synthesis family protein [Haloferula luteola]|uniref:Capsular exopolysaccharide synthesis family protein n=1 Tax=Haloferula luteola TaxID=595692 RepID=A0A840V0I7_9BACT|nr:polysaccharide biosynthesis tyrosine autokinase [Haloferula luteola]MBB5350823.1 capsular exopolysaccharide synthesis family protein [Haloferula luteola]